MEIGRIARRYDKAAFKSECTDKYSQLKQDIVANNSFRFATNIRHVVRGEDEDCEIGSSGFGNKIDQRLTHRAKHALIPDCWVRFVLKIALQGIGDIHRLARGANEQRGSVHVLFGHFGRDMRMGRIADEFNVLIGVFKNISQLSLEV